MSNNTTSTPAPQFDPKPTTTPKPIYAAGRVVGQVVGKVFRKVVRVEHRLRRPPAWAFDIGSLRAAEAAGAVTIELFQSDIGQTFTAPISAVWAHGAEFNRGFGEQIYLTLPHWTTKRPGAEAVQPSLF